MNNEDSANLTELINAAGKGDEQAEKATIEMVYEQLRTMANRLMQNEGNHTLQPTALVNEVYLRLVDNAVITDTPSRAYFFAAAAEAMRRILVEAARKRIAAKRGGQLQRHPFDEMLHSCQQENLDLIELDEAIDQLKVVHPRQANVVNLKWFGHYSVKQISDMLDISISTVEQDWRTAKAFLFMRLSQNE